MSLLRKVKQMGANAEKAAGIINTKILDFDVFQIEGGYAFSWVIGDRPLLLNMKTEGVHVGFVLTEAQIQEQYQLASVEYFIGLFREQLARHGNDTPEMTLDKVEYADNDNTGPFQPLTAKDFEDDESE